MLGSSLQLTPATVAAFVLFIGILIFVHELGHFLAAKYFDIKVLKFSLGFGPPLFRYTRGETVYQIALLPLGGFVKMLGDSPLDDVAEEDRARAFNTVPVHQRAVVAFAGPLFNLIFPVACFFAYYLLGPTVLAPIVGQLEAGSPALMAGLQTGDRVLEIEGTSVWGFDHMRDLVRDRAGDPLAFKLRRGDEVIDVSITPREHPDVDDFGAARTRGIIGVTPARNGRTRVAVHGPGALALGFVTGDKILSVDGEAIDRLSEVDAIIAREAPGSIEVVLSRPQPLRAGDLLLAKIERPQKLTVALPAGVKSLADLEVVSAETFVRAVEPSGAAFRAGLRPGDQIVEVDGKPVSVFYSFVLALTNAKEKPVNVTARRVAADGSAQRMSFTIVNEKKEVMHEATGKMRPYYDAGIGLGKVPRSHYTMEWNSGGSYVTEQTTLTISQAFVISVQQTVKIIGSISLAVFKLFTGGISMKTVGGPIMLFQVAAMAAERGLFTYLHFLALISVNLGIINLVPLPVFDGGHLMFCAIEAIKRKPVSDRVRELATIVGLVLLAVLIVIVFTNDISRISGGLFK